MKVTVIPHRQFTGDLVAFVQFKERPPLHLRDIIKQHGGFYRKGPVPFVKHGWHIRKIKSLAKAVEDEFPKFATKLGIVREKIKDDPESFIQKDKRGDGKSKKPLIEIIKER